MTVFHDFKVCRSFSTRTGHPRTIFQCSRCQAIPVHGCVSLDWPSYVRMKVHMRCRASVPVQRRSDCAPLTHRPQGPVQETIRSKFARGRFFSICGATKDDRLCTSLLPPMSAPGLKGGRRPMLNVCSTVHSEAHGRHRPSCMIPTCHHQAPRRSGSPVDHHAPFEPSFSPFKMSRGNNDEQFKFLISCIRHANNSKVGRTLLSQRGRWLTLPGGLRGRRQGMWHRE